MTRHIYHSASVSSYYTETTALYKFAFSYMSCYVCQTAVGHRSEPLSATRVR